MRHHYYALTFASVHLVALLDSAVAQEHHLLPSPYRLWPRQADTSICLNDTGDCAQSNTLGSQCLSIIGLDPASLEANDTPQNAQKVRDCICNGDYWNHLYACNSCLTANNLYPTDLNPNATPLPTLSSSYCSPSGGRSAIQTIDGFADPVTQDVSGYDVAATPTSDSPSVSSQITGGGAGRVTPSPDATSTDPASARASPYLNHSMNSTITQASQPSSSRTPSSSGAASSTSTLGSSASSTTTTSSTTASSSSATPPSAASATKSSGFRRMASITLQLTVLCIGLFILTFFSF